METSEKVFASQQLICMLPPLALKVMCYLMNWQKYDNIKYYPKQMCGFMHIEESELDVAIQTLVDNNLIDVTNIDGNFCFILNKDTIKKYFDVPMQKVKDHDGLKMSKEITWKKEETNYAIDDMSEDEIKRQIFILTARLNEKKQVKKIVTSPKSNEVDDLPW